MRKAIIIAAVCFIGGNTFLSCGKYRSGYYPKDQWIIPNRWFRHPLRAGPLEVKESLCPALSDTNLEAKGKPNSWELYRFDLDGNISYKKTFIEDSMWFETYFTYDSAGAHYKVISHLISELTHGLPEEKIEGTDASILLRNGKIRVIKKPGGSGIAQLDKNLPFAAELTSFSEGGDLKKVEWMKDTTGAGEPIGVITSYYEGQRLKKIVGSSKTEHVTLQYYYSANNFLDSIISDSAGKTFERQLYVNNSFGDPVRYLDIMHGKDTSVDVTNRYVYDRSGNWTKRLEKTTDKTPDFRITSGTTDAFVLWVRDIVYPGEKRTL